MSVLNIILVSSFLFNVTIDLFEISSTRLSCLFVSFLVPRTFILDEMTWLQSGTYKCAEWLKIFFIVYITCEITLVVNVIHLVANKYSVTSMSWYTPCLLLDGCSLYRKVYKGLILRRARLR
ncbi:hypothetical protein FC650_17600 [Vibrio natriegens]|nr:hypothetical protein [Vibrio natriegens]